MTALRAKHNKLYFDFTYMGVRCREFTGMDDTPANRRKLNKVLKRMEAELALGTFDYARYFPKSKNAERFARKASNGAPLFKEFAEEWFEQFRPQWRVATAKNYRSYLDRLLIPAFGEMRVSDITKADILSFRATVAKQSRGKLKAKTINKYVKCLNMILSEAADSFDFTPPHLSIKPLKEEKVHVEPFSLEEVQRILAHVRPDWRDYLTVRLFTGLRTGEVDGLKWKYVDLERRQILVRETYSQGIWTTTKTDSSQREVDMALPVYEALKQRHARLDPEPDDLVFTDRNGGPINVSNFLNRVWKPLLKELGIKYRKPYQMRHTAATLWLAAGENPGWIARQLGHTDTTMLFKVYARYVPNLTRRDGSALDSLLVTNLDPAIIRPDVPANSTREQSRREEKSDDSIDVDCTKEVEKNQADISHWDQLLEEMGA